jgi:hypothetical protein
METTTPKPTSSAAAGVVALVLAGGAALSLAASHVIDVMNPVAESVVTFAFLAGWVLLAWAAILGGAVAVHLVRTAPHRRPSRIESVLVVATAAVITWAICAYPLAGSGSGVG